MNTRFLIRLLTLTSWFPIVACASSDEGKEASEAVAGNEESAEEENIDTTLDGNAVASDSIEGDGSGNEASADKGGGDANFDSSDGEANGNEAGSKSAADEGATDNTDDEAVAEKSIKGFEADGNGGNFATNAAVGLDGANAVAGTEAAGEAFKNTAIDTDAFSNSANTAENPLAASPAPAAVEAPPAPPPEPAPAPLAVARAPAPEGAVHEIEATPAKLFWVGYKINQARKQLNVEIVTKGRPEYEIFEQANRGQQSELIIRFYHTGLRRKLHWDVNSSEFRSPVAYIRMKEKRDEGYVDLVITHRDKVEPLFYEKDGNFLLSYTIPQRYSAAKARPIMQVKDRAISLQGERPLARPALVVSKLPAVGFPRYAALFKAPPKLEPIRRFLNTSKAIGRAKDGLPESFTKTIPVKRAGEILSRRTLVGVAQDDLENAADEGSGENAAGNTANANTENANSANGGNSASDSNSSRSGNTVSNSANAESNVSPSGKAGNANASEANEAQNNASGAGDLGGDSNSDASAFSNFDDKAEGGSNEKPGNFQDDNNVSNESQNASPSPAPINAPMMKEEAQEVDPQEGSGPKAQYTGKPIFMEFYEAPLSLVLKGFSEETGNNFVFPATIGETPVTVHFKGVPWDEALKAILETYSLGMVRIGDNVVRVDKIASLTGYMQALEAAKQYETRRIPTKVMVFRLNNAVAANVKDKVGILLARDIEIDSRIKISDDDRTNSVVIEAPEIILAKARAIIQRLDLETPQVEITSRIVEVQKSQNSFFGVSWGNNLNFDPGRALGFGTLNFPNSVASNFSVDPGVSGAQTIGNSRFRFGSLNKFLDLDLLLKMEERKGTSDVLQSNRVLVLDGQKATVLAGSSQFFRPAAGGNVINPAAGTTVGSSGLSEITFNLLLEVTPQVTALGNVIMNLLITSDTPGDVAAGGDTLASKSSRKLNTQMVRGNGETGVIGGIYDTKRTQSIAGIPILSDIPIIGALFRSTTTSVSQTELLIMVTPTIVSGPSEKNDSSVSNAYNDQTTILSQKQPAAQGKL